MSQSNTNNAILAQDVFVASGYPTHTYVSVNAGAKEREFTTALSQKGVVVSISGPSKSGKTTLCERMLGSEMIVVNGGSISEPKDLWREAYRELTDDTDRDFEQITHTDVIAKLAASDNPLVIDDFHYIDRAIQGKISQQIKTASADGVTIVCMSVPHRGDDPIRSNQDLSGRLVHIKFDFWTADDLKKIAEQGFEKIGFPIDNTFNTSLAEESLRSPQIMQRLCLSAATIRGEDTPLENIIPQALDLKEVKRGILDSYDGSSVYNILKNGPAIHGKPRNVYKTNNSGNLDVYGCLLEVLRRAKPFYQLSLDEIRSYLASLITREQELPNVRNALQQYADLFNDRSTMACPFDWDDEKRQLTVNDPHFYFYLRNTEML